MAEKITITKRIARQGSQAMLVIPRAISHKIRPGNLVRVEFEVMEEEE